METTTVEVKKKTKEELDQLKHTYQAKTYDDVIRELMKRKRRSMAGKLAIGRKVSMQEILEKLRNERDRF